MTLITNAMTTLVTIRLQFCMKSSQSLVSFLNYYESCGYTDVFASMPQQSQYRLAGAGEIAKDISLSQQGLPTGTLR